MSYATATDVSATVRQGLLVALTLAALGLTAGAMLVLPSVFL